MKNQESVKQVRYFSLNLNSYFDVGSDTVEVKLSTINGRERIYVNSELVSSKWNFLTHSTHAFTIGEVKYEVNVDITNPFAGPFNISLQSQGKQIDSDTLTFSKKYLGILFVAGLTVGLTISSLLFSLID